MSNQPTLNGFVEHADGSKCWRVDGKLHRLDGPAIEYIDGDKAWYVNGERHRTDGPAIEYVNGDKSWWIDGKRHRLDGPAVEYANGDKQWWINGKSHRTDGPAVEYANGDKYWYIDNKELTEQEFDDKIKERIRFRKTLKAFEKAAIGKSKMHLMESWHHPEILKEYKIARRRLLKWRASS